LENVNFSKAFIGIDGYTIETGFTSADMMRAEISSLIVQRSHEVFVLSDSSKFGKVHLASLFYPEDITSLITDSGIPEQDKRYLEDQGVRIHIV
jgi:DeoR/GlpR family transcriptional regulator of sugar metabolism